MKTPIDDQAACRKIKAAGLKILKELPPMGGRYWGGLHSNYAIKSPLHFSYLVAWAGQCCGANTPIQPEFKVLAIVHMPSSEWHYERYSILATTSPKTHMDVGCWAFHGEAAGCPCFTKAKESLAHYDPIALGRNLETTIPSTSILEQFVHDIETGDLLNALKYNIKTANKDDLRRAAETLAYENREARRRNSVLSRLASL